MLILKASHMVKPAEPTPNEIMYLSECDQIRSLYHVPSVYFYGPTSDSNLLDAVHILKRSLSRVLVRFYPLAGRLRWIAGSRLELDCNAVGALFLEAESDSKIQEFGDFQPSSPAILALLPDLDFNSNPIHEVPLLVVQVTRFSCGGIAVGLGLPTTVVDGRSQAYFVNKWAKIARGEDPGEPPFLDRRILQPRKTLSSFGSYNHLEFNSPSLLIGHSDNSQMLAKGSTVAMLKLSTSQIERLRNIANKSGVPNDGKRGYSRFEVVAGHAWRCASKARRLQYLQQTRLDFTMDFHKVMKMPQNYFGRATIGVVAIATAGKLLSEPLGYASGKIREAINRIRDDYVRSHISYIKNQSDLSQYRTKVQFDGNPNLYIVNWANLSFSGVDFGWGKEIYTGPLKVSSEGKAYMLRGPDDDGSLILALRLHLEDIDAFRKLFYRKIDWMISKF